MKVLITMDGGLIQASYVDAEAEAAGLQVVIADYDCEGTNTPEDITEDPNGDEVLIYNASLIADSDYAEKMFALAEPGGA
ncbi:hypothetical protein NRY68_05855 [Acidithiobacillus ferrooxidans]|uniref:hypothetical protein n=1 Tax=Acidithiobacillus ferrooxidans TaxID=920 RepID=UPI002148E5F7|nr:hypothetical protein [Acidithiobacillus ferrooxidans]MCR1345331.1 hypothetical protein [Acidithiobacillus ferrooxidans]MCR1354491.1 hypothetical protein [Acidithiobacillus ferrooxidans]MDA8378392.1 hypothetical protein [Planctomycetia bacterium]